jgi:hypothetical protein
MAVALLVAVAGCGEGEGVAKGAAVTAYVVAPLCAEASRGLSQNHGRAGDLRVRVICLPSVESHRRLKLARVGANARHATEDSTAVAYLEAPGSANRFAEPILESAGIVSVHASSGSAATAELLEAVKRAGDSGNLRESVRDELQ